MFYKRAHVLNLTSWPIAINARLAEHFFVSFTTNLMNNSIIQERKICKILFII